MSLQPETAPTEPAESPYIEQEYSTDQLVEESSPQAESTGNTQTEDSEKKLGWFEKMKSLVRHAISLGILAAGFAVAVLLHSQGNDPGTVTPAAASLPVHTSRAVDFEGMLKVGTDGVVSSLQEIELVAQVGGEIIEKSPNCRVGKKIVKGELLFKIDPKDYQLALSRSQKEEEQSESNYRVTELELEQAKQQIQLDQRNYRLAETELKRMQGLFRQKVISQTDLDNSERAYIVARTSLKNANDQIQLISKRLLQSKAQWDLAKVATRKSQLDLSRTSVLAPISGKVGSCQIEKGGFVMSGGPLIKLQDDQQLEVKTDLLFWQLQWMNQSFKQSSNSNPNHSNHQSDVPNIAAVVEFQADGKRSYWPAHLSSFDSAGLNSGTRMVPVRLTVNPNGPLPSNFRPNQQTPSHENRPPLMTGMFVQVSFFFPSPNPVLQLPSSSIRPGGTVWYEKEGKLAKTKVKIFQTIGDQVIVYCNDNSLKANTQVITSPLPNPIVGMPVSIDSSSKVKEQQ